MKERLHNLNGFEAKFRYRYFMFHKMVVTIWILQNQITKKGLEPSG